MKQTPAVTNRVHSAWRNYVRNSFWNLLSSAIPVLVAIICTPTLLRLLGIERFSLLTITWVFVGYFGFFDFGLGRSLTKLVAAHTEAQTSAEIPSLVTTAMLLVACLATTAGLMTAFSATWLTNHALSVESGLKSETHAAMLLLAGIVPVALITTAFVGILEGFQRFVPISRIRIVFGALIYIVPLLACRVSADLVTVLASLLLLRISTFLIYGVMALRSLRQCSGSFVARRADVPTLLSIGGWLTLTNVVSPIMTYFDRFILGVLVPIGTVAYYTTPYEMLSRFGIVPGALMGVAFPTIAAAWTTNRHQLSNTFGRINALLFNTTLPICAIVVLFAPEGLGWWLSPDFSEKSSAITKCLALGVFINTLTCIPYTSLQACGRPDIPAKVHLLELPVYLVTLYISIKYFGILGAAYSWALRVLIDALLMYRFASGLSPELSGGLRRGLLGLAFGSVILLACLIPKSVETKLGLGFAICSYCGIKFVLALRNAISTSSAAAFD